MKFCSNLFETFQGYYQDKNVYVCCGRVGVGVGWGGGTHLKLGGWGYSSQLMQRLEDSLSCSLKLHCYTLLRDVWTCGWGYSHAFMGWGALTPMCLLFVVIYWSRRPRRIAAFNVALVNTSPKITHDNQGIYQQMMIMNCFGKVKKNPTGRWITIRALRWHKGVTRGAVSCHLVL